MTQHDLTKRNMHLKQVKNTIIDTKVYITYYKDLFCYNQNRVDVINASANTFFVLAGYAMLDSCVLKLSKVTDPADQGKFQNTSMERLLLENVPQVYTAYETIKSDLKKLYDHLSIIREKRNKQLAHSDTSSINTTYPYTVSEIEQAIKLLDSIFNKIIKHLPKGMECDPNMDYALDDVIIDYSSDARATLIMLEKGRRFDRLIESMPLEILEPYFPEQDPLLGKGVFQHDILQFIDHKDIEEEN